MATVGSLPPFFYVLWTLPDSKKWSNWPSILQADRSHGLRVKAGSPERINEHALSPPALPLHSQSSLTSAESSVRLRTEPKGGGRKARGGEAAAAAILSAVTGQCPSLALLWFGPFSCDSVQPHHGH
jgi:hypothetical protein